MNQNSLKPAGPKGKFFWGSTLDFARDTLGFVEQCRKDYPGMAYARIAFRDFYLLFEPEYILHVLQKNQRNYVKSFAYDGLKDFLGEGLLTGEGKQWLKQRRMMQPAFHRQALLDLQKGMYEETERFLRDWQVGKEINILEEMLDLTQRIVTRALFGTEIDQRIPFLQHLATLREYANDKMKNPLKAPLWVPTGKNQAFKQARQGLQEAVMGIIRQRKESGKSGSDLLGMLLEARDESGKGGMSEEELYFEIATLYVAGQETTTNALSFLFYLLAQHPEVETRLREEIGQDFRQGETDLKSMSYSANCLREAMRLYPPAWAISRKAVAADRIGEHDIPAGATVFLSIYAMHRHPGYWNDPNSFQPQRFETDFPKGAYLPFGLGPRMCIGNHFAMMEMQIVLAAILQKFRLELLSPQKLDLITPMTLNPKEAILFRLGESPS